jgi:hypothetical protein
MARLSRRTMAKVETWIDKQKTSKLRKLLVDGWVYEYEPREIEDMSDEEVRELVLSDIKTDDDHVDAVLENINIEVEYSDDNADDDDDSDEEE